LAVLQVAARRFRVVGLAQPPCEPALCGIAGLEQRLTRIRTDPLCLLRNHDADPTGCLAHRTGIVHPEPLAVPREHVTRRVADEAVVEVLAWNDGEVAVGAAVKRTRTAPVAAAALELH